MAKSRVMVGRMRRRAPKRSRPEQEERVPSETNNNTGPGPSDPYVNPSVVLALPALPRNGNQQNEQEEANRVIDQFIIDWYEHLPRSRDEIAGGHNSTEEQTPSERRNSPGAGA